MKRKVRQFNAILLALLLLIFGVGCGKQKVVELPTAETTIESSSEASLVASVPEASTEAAMEAAAEVSQDLPVVEATTPEWDDSPDAGQQADPTVPATDSTEPAMDLTAPVVDEDGIYTSKDDVAAYIHEFGRLPQNFITKKDAKALGWPGGSLEDYAPGKCIGGDRFGNYEGLLPEEKGRKYYECDIDTLGKKSRGAKRIIYSNDGLIFYTEDHYESFVQIY